MAAGLALGAVVALLALGDTLAFALDTGWWAWPLIVGPPALLLVVVLTRR